MSTKGFIKVRAPDGGIVEFPDTMTQKEISAAMKAKFNPAPKDVDFDFPTMVKNIPSSGMQLLDDITYPVRHPIISATGLYNLGTGAVQKLIPGEQDNEKYADAAGQFFKDRYGSVDSLKTTAMNDPLGLLTDLSAVVTGGGALAAKLPGQVGKIGRATQTVGRVIDPITSGINVARNVAGKFVPESMPIKMINSAVKWNTTTDMPTRGKMASTMVNEGIMPTYAGVTKANKIIDQLNTQIDDIINAATDSGKSIKVADLIGDIQEGFNKIDVPEQPNSGKMLDAYLNELQSFADDWKRLGVTEMTPTQVQQFKKNLYKQINFNNLDKAKQVVSEGSDQARLQAARNARKSIEDIDPSISGLNAREGGLLQLNKELPRKASRIENRNSISLNTAPMGVFGGMLDYALGLPGVATTIGIGGSLLDMPRPKARNAIMLQGLRKATMLDGGLLPYALRQGSFNLGRLENE